MSLITPWPIPSVGKRGETEGAKEDMAGEIILSIDEDDKMWFKTEVVRPRATLTLREALCDER